MSPDLAGFGSYAAVCQWLAAELAEAVGHHSLHFGSWIFQSTMICAATSRFSTRYLMAKESGRRATVKDEAPGTRVPGVSSPSDLTIDG